MFGIFIQRLQDRGWASPVIDAETMLPNDPRLKWASDHGDEWQEFVRWLVSTDAARLDRLAASGPRPMLRLRLKVAPDELGRQLAAL